MASGMDPLGRPRRGGLEESISMTSQVGCSPTIDVDDGPAMVFAFFGRRGILCSQASFRFPNAFSERSAALPPFPEAEG